MLPVRRRLVRRRLAPRATLVVLAAVLALFGGSAPALAKLFLEARLDAPISFDSTPGAELLVGVTVTVPDGLEDHVVEGSPIWLRLIGPRGDTTEAAGSIGPRAGHYDMRIKVPDGGPRRLELFVRGGGDLPIFLMDDPFTFRPVGEGTAQLAPPRVAVAPTASAPVTAVRPAPVAEPVVEPAAAAADPAAAAGNLPLLAIPVLAVASLLLVAALVLSRRSRTATRGTA